MTPIYTRTYISRMGIATRIDRMMSERKIKGQSALSRLSGVPQPTIARVLKGRTDTPELSTVKKLAAALGVTTTWLADGPDDPVQYAGESATAVQLAASTVDEVAERASALREMQIAQATAILAGLSDSALSKALGLLQDLRGEPTEDGAKSDDLPMFSRGKSLHEYLGSGGQPIKPEKSDSRKAKYPALGGGAKYPCIALPSRDGSGVKNMRTRILGMAALGMILAGCTTVSDVSPAGNGNYTVGTRHMGGVDSWQEIKASSLRRADSYCKEQGKQMEQVDMKTHGARGWTPLESELTFRCITQQAAG